MEINEAIPALSALAQETRLQVFRRLMRCLPEGVAAGDLAEQIGVPANTMSTHLAILARAGLVHSDRQGRTVYYAADLEGIRSLLQFLVKDCCRGKSEACSKLLEAVLPACCP